MGMTSYCQADGREDCGQDGRPQSNRVKPLAVDLFCGLGGWAEGFLFEGYEVVGFDIERHDYGAGAYPGQLVIQDVLTLHGSQFRDAAVIVASPPCQRYSYMAQPWRRAKREIEWEKWNRVSPFSPTGFTLNDLFDSCFRIQREASEAAGRHIPLVVENVKGAQPWVGRAKWHYGSYYLWGDVPALMPWTGKAQKFNPDGTAHGVGSWFAIADSKNRGASVKNGGGGSWFPVAHGKDNGEMYGANPVRGVAVGEGVKVPSDEGRRTDVGKGARFTTRDCGVEGLKVPGLNWNGHGEEGYRPKGFNVTAAQRYREEQGVKQEGSGAEWFDNGLCKKSSRSDSRKAASAQIAKIPFPLAQHIAQVFKP